MRIASGRWWLLAPAALLVGYAADHLDPVVEQAEADPMDRPSDIPWCAWMHDTACAPNGFDGICYHVAPSESGICFCKAFRWECY